MTEYEGRQVRITLVHNIDKRRKAEQALRDSVRTLWEGQPATLTFIRDITQLKKIEARLQQAEKMEAIGTLAGGIAHDFNNILASIIGYAELTLDDVESGSLVEENLHEVINAGKRTRDLVQKILTFARQNEGHLLPVNVGALAKNVLKLLRSTIPSFIEIETRIDSTATVMADPSRIEQLFINLCSNASHAMEESGGILTVKVNDKRLDRPLAGQTATLAAGNYVQIAVSDTGVGISALNQRSVC